MQAICTIVTRSHLRFARALISSLRRSGNEQQVYLLIVDGTIDDFKAKQVQVLNLQSLDRLVPELMAYYYDAFELCNALKPFLVQFLFEIGFDEVMYLDSDIFCVGNLAKAFQEGKCALTMSPHNLRPFPVTITYSRESTIADVGVLNGGFAVWQKCTKSRAILNWMCSTFPRECFCDRRHGFFVDQKLYPLLLCYFPESVHITRNPCLNIAYWNGHERQVIIHNNRFYIDENEVVFFHMSGFDACKSHLVCSYLPTDHNDQILTNSPWWHDVIEAYSNLLNVSHTIPQAPYKYSEYNGVLLNSRIRRELFNRGTISPWSAVVFQERCISFLKQLKRTLFGRTR